MLRGKWYIKETINTLDKTEELFTGPYRNLRHVNQMLKSAKYRAATKNRMSYFANFGAEKTKLLEAPEICEPPYEMIGG